MPDPIEPGPEYIYFDLMKEIRHRLGTIHQFASTEPFRDGMPRIVGQEFCFLQIRMICETIALSCLAAHGDIKETQSAKFQKNYHAGRIMADLAKLRPNFYPTPFAALRTSATNTNLEPLTSGFFTAPELIALYNKCGDALHRGTMTSFLREDKATKSDLSMFLDIHAKLFALLNQHFVSIINEAEIFIFNMNDENGQPRLINAVDLNNRSRRPD